MTHIGPAQKHSLRPNSRVNGAGTALGRSGKGSVANAVNGRSQHGRLVRVDKDNNPVRPIAPPPPTPSRWPPFMGTQETGALFLTLKKRHKPTDRVRLNWRHPLALPTALAMVLAVPMLVAVAVASKLWRMILYFRG